MTSLHLNEIKIAPERQRQEFGDEDQLSSSIERLGLLHPIVVRHDGTLVAGERRLRAIRKLAIANIGIKHGNASYEPWQVPITYFESLDPYGAYEAELEENVQRRDLTWQERADARARLHKLRCEQNPGQSVKDTARELLGRETIANETANNLNKELIVARQLSDPDVAKAKTLTEALKIIEIKERRARHEAIGAALPSEVLRATHQLLVGDFRTTNLPSGYFDCLVSDPPYGIGVGNQSMSMGATATHDYDDTYEQWQLLIQDFVSTAWRILAENSHAYVFCDFDRFHELKGVMESAGFYVFRKPFAMCKTSSIAAPMAEYGPWVAWECILYALKGRKSVQRKWNDWLVVRGDSNLGMSAQKPVEAYTNLLERSCFAGERVVDLCCGTGPIFPAAHGLKLKATGVEINPATAAIASKRLEELE